jgi:hypothetical protein
MVKLNKTFRIVSIFILLSFFSCIDNEIESNGDGGIGIIVLGKGIEGIILGDSKDVVEQKIGKPSVKGWTDGIYRSWLNYEYSEGPHAGLSINFIDNNNNYGPVDELEVGSPYSGKTKDGIGIGSSLNNVHSIYGKPKNILLQPEQHWIADFYCFGGKKLEIHYVDSIVTTISIGYFIPMEQDTLSSCR